MALVTSSWWRWRGPLGLTLKTTLELRPLYHRKDERIRAHLLLCFFALLLVRILERQTGQSWDHLRSVLERIHLGEFTP